MAERGADILARINPKLLEESCEIVMNNELHEQWEAAQQALLESQEQDAAGGERLATRGKESETTRELAEKVVAIEEQMVAAGFKVTFRQMHKDKWRALCDNHPAREGDILDAHAGYNRDAVLDNAVRLCMIDPIFERCTKDTRDQLCDHTDCGSWEQFTTFIPPGQWELLKDTVNAANVGVVDLPKSELASRILRRRASI